MKQITATVEHGQIKLPESVRLPDGTTVQIAWDEDLPLPPLEPEPLTEEDVQVDLAWATGKRFPA